MSDMPERKLTKEQEEKAQKLIQQWKEEVEQFFEEHKDEEINTNQLDGSRTWELVKMELKYKKLINKELGMDFYKDVVEVENSKHKENLDTDTIALALPKWLAKRSKEE